MKLQVGDDVTARDIHVTTDDGSPVPFTLRDKTVDFFAGAPGAVRVLAGDHEYMYSLTLPQLGDTKWEAPPAAPHGIPHFSVVMEHITDVVAMAGASWAAAGIADRMAAVRPLPHGEILRA